MKTRSLLIISTLAVASIGIASAKSYSVILGAPAKAGATELKAGGYQVDIKGSDAIFTNDGGKTFKVPVTIEQNDKKYSTTSVQSDGDSISEIDLGGSTTKLKFAK